MSSAPFDLAEPDNETEELADAGREAEQAVIGAVLSENAAWPEGLTPEHFQEGVYATAWKIIGEWIAKNRLAEPIALKEALQHHPAFEEIGGIRHLAELVIKAPPSTMAQHFADIVIDAALRRRLVETANAMGYALRKTSEPGVQILAETEKSLAELAHHGGAQMHWQSAGAVTASALTEARAQKGMVGISTGLADIDDATGGLRRGELVVVAARPGMGKSSAGLQLCKAAARRGAGAIFFSMEMALFNLGLRMACDVAHDPMATLYSGQSVNPRYFDASRGRLTEEQWWRLDEAKAQIEPWPLLIDDRAGLRPSEMLSAARRQFRAWERAGIQPGVVVIDHLTIARPDQDRRGNKVAEVGDISRSLAEMAKSLDVSVVALCQLSRDVEKRGTDKRPVMSDLRWAGEIEQDARVAAFLYRPEYYVRKPEDPADFEAEATWRADLDKVRNKLFWLIEKNNNGPTAQIETYCDIACSAIRDKLGGARGAY